MGNEDLEIEPGILEWDIPCIQDFPHRSRQPWVTRRSRQAMWKEQENTTIPGVVKRLSKGKRPCRMDETLIDPRKEVFLHLIKNIYGDCGVIHGNTGEG